MKTTLVNARVKMLAAWMMGYLAILFILFPGKELVAQRSLPTNDVFDYATGALQVVGQDWSRISGSSNDLLVTTGNVTYNGYLGAVGKKATLANGANDDLKLTFVSQNSIGTTVYAAFTISVANTTGLTAAGTYCFILGSGTNNFAARVFVKLSGSGYAVGISKTTTAPTAWSASLPVTTSQLIVMSYEIKSGSSNDVANLWMNPQITTIAPTPDFTTSAGTDFGGGTALDGFMLRQATGTPNVSLDALSISTQWSDLMKNPLFTASGILGTGNYEHVTVSGVSTTVSLSGSITIQSSLTLEDGVISPGGQTVGYSANGLLNYSGSLAKTTSEIEFPETNGPAHLTIANSGGTILAFPRQISGNLTINDGAHLTIQPLQSLSVSGTTTLDGTESLIIESDATGTGSFIDHGVVSVADALKMTCYLTGYDNINDGKYHLLSSPVANQSIQPAFVSTPPSSSTDLYAWDEPTSTWVNSKSEDGSWNSLFEDHFVVGQGFLVAYPSTETKSFVGIPNSYSATSPFVVSCTHGSSGWNLLGNPFPSALDWNLIQRGPGIDNALYYYDPSIQNYRYYLEYAPGYAVGNGSQYIPPLQGFMVHANTNGDKSLQFDNDARTHLGQNIYYKSDPDLPVITVSLSSDVGEDETFIYFSDHSTSGFDSQSDAFKMSRFNATMPQIYSIGADHIPLAVNGIPKLTNEMEVKLGIHPGMEGNFQLSMKQKEAFPSSMKIELTDLDNQNKVDLLQEDYSFHQTSVEDHERFVIRIHLVNTVDDPSRKGALAIKMENGQLTVKTNGVPIDGDVELYDLTGRLLYRMQCRGTKSEVIPIKVKVGVYVVRMHLDGGSVSQKVMVY